MGLLVTRWGELRELVQALLIPNLASDMIRLTTRAKKAAHSARDSWARAGTHLETPLWRRPRTPMASQLPSQPRVGAL